MIKLWSFYTKNQRSMSFLSLVDSSRVTYLYSMISINLDWTVHRFSFFIGKWPWTTILKGSGSLVGRFQSFDFQFDHSWPSTTILRGSDWIVERFQAFSCWEISIFQLLRDFKHLITVDQVPQYWGDLTLLESCSSWQTSLDSAWFL